MLFEFLHCLFHLFQSVFEFLQYDSRVTPHGLLSDTHASWRGPKRRAGAATCETPAAVDVAERGQRLGAEALSRFVRGAGFSTASASASAASG